MTKIISFFGVLFGFVSMCVLLAGVTQTSEAREDIASACAYVSSLDDGYGFAQPAAVCGDLDKR